MPTVHIGPDVSIRGLCGSTTQAPVASVDERGAGVTQWSLSVQGDPAFVVRAGIMTACQANGPTVGFVRFVAPPDQLPGQTFDAVVTVHADDGSFADGTVNVHAEIVAPQITVDTKTIDFGDVRRGVVALHTVTFNAPSQDLSFMIDTGLDTDFRVQATAGPLQKLEPSLHSWDVIIQSFVLGDHSTSMTWRAFPTALPTATAACTLSATIDVHARVVELDAGASDGGDGGPADDGPDGGDAPPRDAP
jgi:hypothetical protein